MPTAPDDYPDDVTNPGLDEGDGDVDATNAGLEDHLLEEDLEDQAIAAAHDPVEDAWLHQRPDEVEELARVRLAENPHDGRSHAWLGLAMTVTGRAPHGRSELRVAFDLLRDELERAKDPEWARAIDWEMHAIANRLVDSLTEDPENPSAGVDAARFVSMELGFDHTPSLRLLAEHTAGPDGDPVGATQFLKRALAVDPSDPESHYLAARLMARLGKKPQVLSHLQKAIDFAQGTMNVRMLARFEPDFDGFAEDVDFAALVDPFPSDETLRELYLALDAGDLDTVLELSRDLSETWPKPLDILYPWREALDQLSAQNEEEPDEALADEHQRVQEEIESLEEAGGKSEVYARFAGEA